MSRTTTVRDRDGEEHTGEVVEKKDDTSWGQIFAKTVIAAGTAGLSEIMKPDPDVTVRGEDVEKHTGREVKR